VVVAVARGVVIARLLLPAVDVLPANDRPNNKAEEQLLELLADFLGGLPVGAHGRRVHRELRSRLELGKHGLPHAISSGVLLSVDPFHI
jgi:hypothetical protein